MATDLTLGQRVQLEVYDPGSESWLRYDGAITLLAEDRVALGFAKLVAVPTNWTSDTLVTVRYVDRDGSHTCITQITNVVTNPIVGIVLPAQLDFVVEQRRRFARIPARFSVAVVVVDSAMPQSIGRRDNDAATEDLSAGGMRFCTTLDLHLGDVLDTTLTVTVPQQHGSTVFQIPATVVRLCGPTSGEKTPHGAACQFFFTREVDRSRLVRLVQQLQLLV